MKEMQRDEFAPGEPDSSGGATGIFGVVKSSAENGPELRAKEEAAAVPSVLPEVHTSTITMREVVFKATDHATFEDTDALRRILDPSPVTTIIPVESATDASGAGGFTQLLRAMSPQAVPAAGFTAVPAAASFPPDVSSASIKSHSAVVGGEAAARIDADPQASSLPHTLKPPPEPIAVAGGEESFTQMFGVSPTPVTSAAPSAAAPSSQNVGFTQLFQSLKGKAPGSQATVLPAVAPAPIAPIVSSGIGDAPVRDVAPFAPEQAPVKPPEGAVFSQPVSMPALAREILHESDSGAKFSSDAPGGGIYTSAPEARPQPVGSFTQLFQTLAKPGGPVLAEPVKSPGVSSSGDPGSFTQLFSSLGSRPPAQMTQADSFPPLNPSNQPSHGGFGGNEGFASPPIEAYSAPSYREPAYREPRASEPIFSTPPPTNVPPAEGGGEMTRLMRRLDSASYGQAAPPPLRVEPLPIASVAPELGRMAAAPEAFRVPEPSAANFGTAPVEPAANPGAGGMTRILDASALRESLRRGGGVGVPGSVPSAATSAVPSATGSGGGFPAMPGYPSMPSVQMPSVQTQPMPPQPMQLPPMPAMQMPAMPQVPQAEVATPAGGGKSWVPILLIVIIVLLVGILLAVVLLMKK